MRVWPGQPYPLGAVWDGQGVNFAIFSESATVPDVQHAVDIALQSPPHLSAGQHYTWEIVDPSNTIRTFMEQDKYPAGTSSVELAFGGTWDFQFRTWMLADCP